MSPSSTAASLLCLTLVIVTVGYLLTCAAWPFGPCRRCSGTGRRRAPLGRYFRLCHRCDGTGRRIRLGRHLWNYLARIHREGSR